jgi:hypothetical protein
MRANHSNNEFLFSGQAMKLARGQFVTGREVLSRETGIEKSKVYRILNFFETEQQIEQRKTNKFTVITVLNYQKYQNAEQRNEQPVNSKRTTNEQPVNTNNNENNSTMKQTYAQGFARFWKAYPKKKSKGQAEKSWAKLKPSEQLVDLMVSKIKLAMTSEDWNRDNGQYIPHPATWLNAKCWEDEFCPAGPGESEWDRCCRVAKEAGLAPFKGAPEETKEQFMERVNKRTNVVNFR